MARRSIGQERFGFAGRIRSASSLDELGTLIDWGPVSILLDPLYSAAKGEPAWPPLAIPSRKLFDGWQVRVTDIFGRLDLLAGIGDKMLIFNNNIEWRFGSAGIRACRRETRTLPKSPASQR